MTEINLEEYYKVDFAVNTVVTGMELTWTMTYESDEEVDEADLCGEPYDKDKDYSPKAKVKPEIKDWILENITGKVFFNFGSAYFENGDEAMAFKLKWT